MTALTIEALGLSKDELIERLIDKAAEDLLSDRTYDEDGEPYGRRHSQFRAALDKRIAERIDKAIDEIAAKNVLPNVAAYVEGLCLQATNEWGEKKGAPVTFIEYLVKRAENSAPDAIAITRVDGQTFGQQIDRRRAEVWLDEQERVTRV
jgi:hypothetical protein